MRFYARMNEDIYIRSSRIYSKLSRGAQSSHSSRAAGGSTVAKVLLKSRKYYDHHHRLHTAAPSPYVATQSAV
jgi:hypothetical protein